MAKDRNQAHQKVAIRFQHYSECLTSDLLSIANETHLAKRDQMCNVSQDQQVQKFLRKLNAVKYIDVKMKTATGQYPNPERAQLIAESDVDL